MKTLLCVEDERTLLKNNREFFERLGYRVLPAETLAEARSWLIAQTPDAILLDIMLPDGNGLDLLQELRAAGSTLPIIMLTAWGEPQDVSRGYRLGATAYISKPFDYEAVRSALESILQSREQVPEVVTKGPLALKLSPMIALLFEKDMLLTQKEFALLLLFVQNEGRTIRAEYLYERVWNAPMGDDNRTLKKHISSIRKRLEEGNSGYTITSIRGKGYRLEKTS